MVLIEGLPGFAHGVVTIAQVPWVSYGPLASLKGSELWALILKVAHNGVLLQRVLGIQN